MSVVLNRELWLLFVFVGFVLRDVGVLKPLLLLLSILSDLTLLKILAPGPIEFAFFLSKLLIDVFEHVDNDPIVLTFPFIGSLPVE